MPFSTTEWLQAPGNWTKVKSSEALQTQQTVYVTTAKVLSAELLLKINYKFSDNLPKWSGFPRLFWGLPMYTYDSDYTVSVVCVFG